MGRYPAEPLEDKLAWMRERQRQRQEAEARGDRPKLRVTEAHRRRERSLGVPRMLRVNDVVNILGVSRRSVMRAFAKQIVRLGSCVLIPEQAVNDALGRRPH